MPEPIVFISRNKIKEGKVDEFRKHYQDSIPPIYGMKSQAHWPNWLMKMRKPPSLQLFASFPARMLLTFKSKEPMNDQKRPTHLSSPSVLRSLAHPILLL